MNCGISTACFYPTDTQEALKILGQMKQNTAEIFLNTFSELENDYLMGLKEIAQQHQIKIVSIHPFSSGFEPFLFFTDYKSRFSDGEKLYRKFFAACNMLGADKLVFHGNTRYHLPIDMKQYAERFLKLSQIAFEEYGVALAQENVERCCCGLKENVTLLREYTNDKVKFVLDLKQARRIGICPLEMLEAMGADNICHLHLSDADENADCLSPGEGKFDFLALFEKLNETKNSPITKVVELYSNNFSEKSQLLQGVEYIQNIQQGGTQQ